MCVELIVSILRGRLAFDRIFGDHLIYPASKLASWTNIEQARFSTFRLPNVRTLSVTQPPVVRPNPNQPNSNSHNAANMSASLFTISPSEASRLVKNQRKRDDEKCCFLLQVSFQSVYSDSPIPNTCLKKLPRLLNGIPLGPGVMARDQMESIRWRYVEGGTKLHTFISVPMYEDEAEESKRTLKDSLMKQSQAVFGDITVKASVILSHCINFDDDLIINDIAVPLEEGLHFRD